MDAEKIYRQLLAEHPGHADANYNLGNIFMSKGRFSWAVACYREAIRHRPDFAQAHGNLASALNCLGQLDAAVASNRQVVRLLPDSAMAHYNLALTLQASGQFNEAIAVYRHAIELDPHLALAHNNLGIALQATGMLKDAIESFRLAIQLMPDYVDAHFNLGVALHENGHLSDAIASYQTAIRLKPDYANAHGNLGGTFRSAGQLDLAIASYKLALCLQPDLAEAHSNLGNVLRDIGRVDEAIFHYREAIRLKPGYSDAHSNLVFGLQFHPGADVDLIRREHRLWNQLYAHPLRKFIRPHANDPNPSRPLRIGYVSPDFRDHVVGQNILPLLRHHDRQQFQVFCYSNTLQTDEFSGQIRQHADIWRNITRLSDSQAADLIREDQIDILVDLSLHTAHNRLLVFARKPAPVQISYLGYCSTTGLDAMDFRLSDPYLDPPDSDLSVYSEKTIRLPETYWCYNPRGPTPPPSPSPAETAGYVTFGCLNNFAKVTPALDLWAQILRSIPASRLILHSPPGAHLAAVRRQFAGNGISPDRLEFPTQQPWPDYIRTYGLIDITLDPFPWCGGITTCDALWMGVPVVTLAGRTAVGRGGASILSNIRRPELIARTRQEYLQIAILLAGDCSRLIELRRTLRRNMQASPLMDAPRFTRNFEAIYRQLWRNWCENYTPRK